MLKPQDIAILVTVMIIDSEWTYREIADKLDMSPSSVHDGLARADLCNLFNKDKRRVLRRNLLEFLVHGIQYAFPVPPKPVSRGILTGYAVPLQHSLRPNRRHSVIAEDRTFTVATTSKT